MGVDEHRRASGAAVSNPPAEPAGRGLSEPEFRSAVGAVEHAVDARYEWDAGVAVGRFLDGLREGRILGRSCQGCERVLVPPRMFCERCFRPTDAWVEVEATGTVQTYSVCHVAWDMRPLDAPELPAVIAIDGSDGGFLHVLGEVDAADVTVGMAVEAVWKHVGERQGSILDIAYFRPRRGV
ncbi:MAG TPA: Zn-ribbon domain-containing OB-fold protein [Actinomycetota bacterium]|nr:Zn-ribbon domain-containing OB-fold protein [Actinomycetota bacterium]